MARAAALAALAWCAPGVAVVGDPDGVLGVGGSLRVAPAVAYDPQVAVPPSLTPDQRALVDAARPGRVAGTSQVLLRLTADGAPARGLRYEAHVVQEYTSSSDPRSGLGLGQVAGGGGTRRYRAVGGAWWWEDTATVSGRIEVDRLSVKLALPRVDLTVGRQAITFGKASFWNPLDVFLAFDPIQFDRDYKRGVDALRVDAPLGDFSGLTLVGVPGQGPDGRSWYAASVLGRLNTVVAGTDLALQGGKIYGGYQLGGGVEREVGPVELRGEMTWFRPDEAHRPSGDTALPEAVTAVAGGGHRFASGLTLDAEYLFNGAGRRPRSETWPLVLGGHLLHTSRHVVGASAVHEPTALLKVSLACLVSLSDGSMVVQPGLTYSAANEVDVVAGAVIGDGARPEVTLGPPPGAAPGVRYRSEFGSYPRVFYLEVKAYF